MTPRGSHRAARATHRPSAHQQQPRAGASAKGATLLLFVVLGMGMGSLVISMGMGILQMRGLPRSGFLLGPPDTCVSADCLSTQSLLEVHPHLDA